MAPTVRVLGFAGSLRRKSFNRALLRLAVERVPAGMTIETFDLAPLPLYNADYETDGIPAVVEPFRAKVRAADALLLASPEYNHGISGVLKNAIDWASRPPSDAAIARKPVAIMGASAGYFGTVRGQQMARIALNGAGAIPMPRPTLMVSKAEEKFDADGRLLEERSIRALDALLLALITWTRRMQADV